MIYQTISHKSRFNLEQKFYIGIYTIIINWLQGSNDRKLGNFDLKLGQASRSYIIHYSHPLGTNSNEQKSL